MFSKMLTFRFGPLPENVKLQLAHANLDQLSQWENRFYEAESLDSIFKV